MISLAWVQRLLVLSALVWAITPRWGGFLFVSSWVLLAIGSAQRSSRARKLLTDELVNGFPAEARPQLQKYALGYVWPELADKWGTTWQLAGLLCILIGFAFAAWALFTLSLWPLLLLVPLAFGLVFGGAMARRLKIAERVKEDLRELKPTHEALMVLVRMKTAAGQWPPQPPPEGG
jgi:hypothetical protein